MLADKNAAQAQVDEAAAELTEKMEALKEKADTSGLSAAIAAAEGKQEADYTPETWEPFAEALEYAKACLLYTSALRLPLLLEEDGLVKISFLNNSFSDIAP